MNVVFDFGAVLFTWQPVELVRARFAAHAPTPAAARQLAHAIFAHDDWQGFDRGVHLLPDVVARTAQRLQLPAHELDAMLSPIGERLTPIAESVALLERLRQRREQHGDVRLFFLSNMPEPYARTLEQRHDFLQWFDGGIFSGDVRLVKPDPAIFTLLAERHGLAPAQTVFIDDLADNIQAARALGWHGIHFEAPAQAASQLSALLGHRAA